MRIEHGGGTGEELPPWLMVGIAHLTKIILFPLVQPLNSFF